MNFPLLLAHLKTGRLAHTYLFTGPENPKKTEIVTRFAQALNCEKGARADLTPSPASCCLSCSKIEKRIHPDVSWLGEDEKARSLKMEEIQTLLHRASLKPFEGRWKVFILKGADRLTFEAANALLKTLEEPPAHSVFLLLAENRAHLLETIQSRACEIKIPPLPEKNPMEDPAVRIFHEKGNRAFFERLQEAPRPELIQHLEGFMSYLRDCSEEVWKNDAVQSKKYLEAAEGVYEIQKALDANVNQKLALTRLEMQLQCL